MFYRLRKGVKGNCRDPPDTNEQKARGRKHQGTADVQCFKMAEPGAEEMAQWSRALIALAEGLGSILSIYMLAQTILTPVPGIPCPLLTSMGTRYTYKYLGKTHVYTHN